MNRNILSRLVRHSQKNLKKMTICPECKMVSFDVVSIFTKVLLDETTDIIIKRIHDRKKINTDIHQKEMIELPYLCAKMHSSPLATKCTFRLMV